MTSSLALVALWLASAPRVDAFDSDPDTRLGSAGGLADGNVVRDLQSHDLVSMAAHEFGLGMESRHDAAKARPRFRVASRCYDELWRRGLRDPNLALNRAHAHRLAGDLPSAIVALNEGLAAARWSRPLQVALEDARAAVAYPTHSDLEALCRPRPSTTMGTRMHPLEAGLIAGVLWFLACGGIARFYMTKAGWWLGFAGVWLVVLAGLGALWLHDEGARAPEQEHERVVIARDVDLRRGNAEAYPLRLDGPSRLPRGVEARSLARRGGWMQIQLASGITGWVPDSAALKIAD